MVEFISKRRYANFEGCKFHLFTFRTDNERKITKLRNSKMYGNEFQEIGADGAPIKKDDVKDNFTIEELRAILAEKELHEERRKANMVDSADGGNELTLEWIEKTTDYKELKAEAEAQGAKFSGNPKKEEVKEFLRGLLEEE